MEYELGAFFEMGGQPYFPMETKAVAGFGTEKKDLLVVRP